MISLVLVLERQAELSSWSPWMTKMDLSCVCSILELPSPPYTRLTPSQPPQITLLVSPGMGTMGNTYHLSTWEVEEGGQQVQGHPHL